MNTQKDWKIKLKVLVTGGAGYIGSHTCVELLKLVMKFLLIDNLCNGHELHLSEFEVLLIVSCNL